MVPAATAVAGMLAPAGQSIGQPTGQPPGPLHVRDVDREVDREVDRDVDREVGREVDRVLGRLREDLGRALKKLGDSDDELVGGALDRFTLALCDARLRERLVAAASEPSGLRAVAKDYARAATRLGAEDQRVLEVEELCAMIGMTLDPHSSTRPGSIWVADRVGAVAALVAIARGASALVVCDAASETAVAIARAGKLPLVTGVAGLFGCVRAGDLLAVDGGAGTVLVHPAPTEIERLRRERIAP
jgi:signal transduction protein with GAF and PtsI domain